MLTRDRTTCSHSRGAAGDPNVTTFSVHSLMMGTTADPEFNLGVEYNLFNHMSGTDEFCTEPQTRLNSRPKLNSGSAAVSRDLLNPAIYYQNRSPIAYRHSLVGTVNLFVPPIRINVDEQPSGRRQLYRYQQCNARNMQSRNTHHLMPRSCGRQPRTSRHPNHRAPVPRV